MSIIEERKVNLSRAVLLSIFFLAVAPLPRVACFDGCSAVVGSLLFPFPFGNFFGALVNTVLGFFFSLFFLFGGGVSGFLFFISSIALNLLVFLLCFVAIVCIDMITSTHSVSRKHANILIGVFFICLAFCVNILSEPILKQVYDISDSSYYGLFELK